MRVRPARPRARIPTTAYLWVGMAAGLVALGATARASSATIEPFGQSSATSVSVSGSTYVTIPMGDLGDPLNTFWQLFQLAPGAAHWTLETPTGVADNGGLVVEAGSTSALSVAILPSQYLKFTPFATRTARGGWSEGGLIPAALVAAPQALVATTHASYAAVTADGGEVLASRNAGLSWSRVVSSSSLELAAGGSCRVGPIRSLASPPSGALYVGTSCSSGTRAGVFVQDGSSWHDIGSSLGALARNTTSAVLAISASHDNLAVLIESTQGSRARLLLARSSTAGASWTTSSPLEPGAPSTVISFGTFGTEGAFVLWQAGGGTFGATVSGPRWATLPRLPGAARTLAFPTGTVGTIDALGGHHSTFYAWRLDARAHRWYETQSMDVPIVYGSSG